MQVYFCLCFFFDFMFSKGPVIFSSFFRFFSVLYWFTLPFSPQTRHFYIFIQNAHERKIVFDCIFTVKDYQIFV